ncbi:MAG: hypothetical protein K9M84_01255 [Spirochaetia bacterium]|nr:hypothetical protein [Spirochaetia bacterium]
MKKRLYSVSILTALLSLFMLSCNLDGAGIFLSQSQAQVVPADDEIDTVDRIINVDTGIMYIQQGLIIKLRDISDDESSWEEVTALNGTVNSAVHAGSSYYIALNDYNENDTTIYELTTALSTTTEIVDGVTPSVVSDIDLGSLFEDGTHAFALYLDGTDVKLTALDGPVTGTIISGADMTPSTDSFSLYEGTTSHLFVTVSDASGDRSSYYGTYDGTTLSSFNLLDPDTITGIESYLVGGTIFGTDFFLYTKEGDVLRTAVSGFSPTTSTFTSVLADDLSLDLDDTRSSGIPTVQVTGSDTDIYALIAGNSSLYMINLTDAAAGTVTPTEPTADAGNYYYNFSSSQVLDFYDTSGVADWSFFVSTSGSSVLEVTLEDAPSEKL